MSREDFDGGYSEWAKEQHKLRVAKTPERIAYAIEQFKKHSIEYELKNEQTGHFHCRRKSDDKLFQFYAGTGKIVGYERRGIHALIEWLDDDRRSVTDERSKFKIEVVLYPFIYPEKRNIRHSYFKFELTGDCLFALKEKVNETILKVTENFYFEEKEERCGGLTVVDQSNKYLVQMLIEKDDEGCYYDHDNAIIKVDKERSKIIYYDHEEVGD